MNTAELEKTENAESTAPVKENKMGVLPVGKLVFSMSLPMMVSMLVQALYNIVDSLFVSQINQNAFTGVSLAFPLQNLIQNIIPRIVQSANIPIHTPIGPTSTLTSPAHWAKKSLKRRTSSRGTEFSSPYAATSRSSL